MTPRKPRTPLWKRLTLLGLGLLAALLLGVAGIWIFDALHPGPRFIDESDYPALRAMLDQDNSPQGLYLFDADLGYRFKPGYQGIRHKTTQSPHHTNSLGLLGTREVSETRQTRSILFLGDSVTYGDGVAYESVYVSRLESLAGPEFPFFNGACPGWNMRQQIEFFSEFLDDVDWELVVVAICLNDFVDFGWRWSEQTGYQWMIAEPTSTHRNFQLSTLRKGFADTPSQAALSLHDDASLMAWQEERVRRCLQTNLLPPVSRDQISNLLLVVLPTRHQLDALSSGAEETVAMRPQATIREFCRENGITYIDAWTLLREAGAPRTSELYRAEDALHFSENGHQLLAKALWPAIERTLGESPPSGTYFHRY